MKKIKYILILFCLIGWSSCNNELLTEVPKDFLSPENSFKNKTDFESALANIYLTIRTNMYANADSWQNFDLLGVDVDFGVLQPNDASCNEYFYWNTINADNAFSSKWWTRFYDWIYQTNVIIDRSEVSTVSWASTDEKNAIVGEAKFIRAFAYHFLANMWGDVPLVLNETQGPKFDYTRSPQKEVYNQCKKDLEFALQWMPTIDKLKGGRASQAAAYHLLTEVNICLNDYQGAIDAASKVINDQNFSLMTNRFGVRKDFKFNDYDYRGAYEAWGDVYWDLFQEGNMNWSEGNHEAIWNVEFDPKILGGGNIGQWGGNFGMERHLGTTWWAIKDKNGTSNWLKDTLSGRPMSAVRPTPYVSQKIWEYKNDWNNDIRNSKYNIQRTFYWTNPSSKFYGTPVTADNVGDLSSLLTLTGPFFKKYVSAVHYNQFQDATSKQGHDGGRIYKDWYIMRLPETYLLRAEAYYRKGDNTSAANDINVVRNRAKATPVVAGDVNIDLILDERARELYMEEFRINTLLRTGKLKEYLMKYNPAVIKKGYTLDDHINKLPIPRSEIEANKDAELKQNPGY